MAVNPKPRLHYFPSYGRAEVLRTAMHYFSVDYEEEVILPQKWPGVKHTGVYEFQQLPMLEIDGKRLVQTASILRYLCQTHNAYSTSQDEIALIEGIVEMTTEIFDKVIGLMLEGKVEIAKRWYETNMPAVYFPMIERLLESNPAGRGKYFVGSHVTMADFAMFELGFTAFQRPQMSELEQKFASMAPRYFGFLRSFKEERESLRRYMSEPKDKPF